jgi:hypothetical protein
MVIDLRTAFCLLLLPPTSTHIRDCQHTHTISCSTLALSRGRRTAMDACAHVQGRAELTVTALCSSAKHIVHSSHTDASHHKHLELCQLTHLRDISQTNVIHVRMSIAIIPEVGLLDLHSHACLLLTRLAPSRRRSRCTQTRDRARRQQLATTAKMLSRCMRRANFADKRTLTIVQ